MGVSPMRHDRSVSPAPRAGRSLLWWLAAAAVANLIAVGLHWINEVGPGRGWLTVFAFAIQVPALVVLAFVLVIARRRRVRSQQLGTEGPAE